MNATAFLVDALTAALELGVATPADVVRHLTPERLAAHLPRPLWARLLTACLGAPRLDAQLVLETVGIANLCAHLPAPLVWGCLAELGARALGGAFPTGPSTFVASAPVVTRAPPAVTAPPAATAPPVATPLAIGSPPPPEPRPVAPEPRPVLAASIPLPSIEPRGEAAEAERPASLPTRVRTPTSQRFRQAVTGLGRLTAGQRRPQAQASAPEYSPDHGADHGPDPGAGIVAEIARHVRLGETEVEAVAADVRDPDKWKRQLVVDDELVDWPMNESTATADVDEPKR